MKRILNSSVRKVRTNTKIRKGDRVLAISGNDEGRIGTVLKRVGDKAIVEGLNVRKKTMKKSEQAPKGRIIDVEAPIHVSNLKVCVEGDSPAKLRVRKNEDGDREFVYKQGGQELVYRSVKKPK